MKNYKLKDITDVITCGVAKRPQYVDNGVMFLSSQNVKSDKIILSKYNMISEEDYEKLTKINKPEKGDILYTRVGSFGEAAVVDFDEKFAVYVSLTLIKPKKDLINNRYLMHYLNSPKVKEYAMNNTRGIGVQNLNVDTVRDFDIILPDLKTQKKIVEVLDKAQELIDKRKEQIDALDELVKSRFIDMFGDLYNNPKGWRKETFGEIVTIERGGSPRPINEYITDDINGINWIKIGDTSQNSMYIKSTKEKIKPEGIKKSRYVKEGDLLLSNSMSFGRPYILKTDGCIHDGWLVIRDDYSVFNKIYLCTALGSEAIYNQFKNMAVGGVVNNLNKDMVKGLSVCIPPIELQNQFADFVNQVDKLKSEMETSLKELEDNFNSLMQKAFKGEPF